MTDLQYVQAPFTAEQVESLNAYQDSGAFHPFTCNGGQQRVFDHVHEHAVALVAQEDAWHCPECEYTQDWAWSWMADGSWNSLLLSFPSHTFGKE